MVEPSIIIIDAIYLKAHHAALSVRSKREFNSLIWFFISAGEVNNYTSVAAFMDALPAAKWLFTDHGYNADGFREALRDKKIRAVSIAGKRARFPLNTKETHMNDAT